MDNVDIKVWRYSNELDPQLRETLIVEFDAIADQIFSKQGNVFKQRESFYFNDTTGLAVATMDGRLIAYSIYKRLNVLGEVVLYSVATNVTPEHQSGGLRRRFLKSMVQTERQSDNVAPTYLAFRTRNPIAWHVFWRSCSSIMPNYVDPAIDPKLVDLGIATAKQIFPELEVERPTMIVGMTSANIATTMTRLRPSTSAIVPVKGAVSATASVLTVIMVETAAALAPNSCDSNGKIACGE